MKRLDKINIVVGISTLVMGLSFAPAAFADGPNDYGCRDESIGCTSWGFNGNCLYNVSNNACECRGEYPFGGGPFSHGSADCMLPRVE